VIPRPGVKVLFRDVLAGKFDLVVVEALGRLSRDQEDIAGLFQRLRFAGAPIATLSEGEVSELHVGLKGFSSRTLAPRPTGACEAASRRVGARPCIWRQ
jgi:hypothetical protein